MRLGIIGSGMIVGELLEQLAVPGAPARHWDVPGLSIPGILSTSRSLPAATQLASRHGIPSATDSFEELLASGIDTAYIAVPNHLHAETARRALQAGLHVILEKPATSTDRELEELMALREESGSLLFEAITTLHLPLYGTLRQWLPRIGQLRLASCSYSQYSRRFAQFQAGEVLPVFDPARSGGAFMDLGLYTLHFLVGLLGEPESAVYHANIDRGIDTSGVLLLRYPGFLGTCTAAKDSTGIVGAVLQGTEGTIRVDGAPNALGSASLELRDGTRESSDEVWAERRLVPQLRVFARAIETGDTQLCQRLLEQSLAVSRTLTRARLEAGIRFPADDA